MRPLTINEVQNLEGGKSGSAHRVVSAFCAGAYVASIIAPNPVIAVVDLACAANHLFGWV